MSPAPAPRSDQQHLQETLDEEKKTNEKLNELALGGVNEEAMTAAGSEK